MFFGKAKEQGVPCPLHRRLVHGIVEDMHHLMDERLRTFREGLGGTDRDKVPVWDHKAEYRTPVGTAAVAVEPAYFRGGKHPYLVPRTKEG